MLIVNIVTLPPRDVCRDGLVLSFMYIINI